MSNARLIAELQSLQIGLVIVGGDLNRLPEVMRPVTGNAPTNAVGISQSEMNQDSQTGEE